MADLQIVPAYNNNVEPQYVEMKVPLYSYGCERKVKKALSNLRGIYSVNVDYVQQKVTVWGICNKCDVLTTIRNKRKGARFWMEDDNTNFEEMEKRDENSASSYANRTHFMSNGNAILIKAKSFSYKAIRKVFNRSLSF